VKTFRQNPADWQRMNPISLHSNVNPSFFLGINTDSPLRQLRKAWDYITWNISHSKNDSEPTCSSCSISTTTATTTTNNNNNNKRRRSERIDVASGVMASAARNRSRTKNRRHPTPSTIQPSNATEPFTRTERLRRRRRLELQASRGSRRKSSSSSSSNNSSSNASNSLFVEDEDYDDDLEVDNPLNGYMDVITMDRIISPAISPSGQVMGMASWVKCLKEYGRCPITFHKVHPEDLQLLTYTNFPKFNKLHHITDRLRKYET